MRAADVVDARVAGAAGHDVDAHAAAVLADDSGLAGEVEVDEDVGAVRSDARDVAGAHQLAARLAGRAVAVLLGALESFEWTGRTGMPRAAATLAQTASTSSPITPTMQDEYTNAARGRCASIRSSSAASSFFPPPKVISDSCMSVDMQYWRWLVSPSLRGRTGLRRDSHE
jgi:hypothetical protein